MPTTKLLVLCPNCEINGYKVILGETLPNGNFAILRRTHTTVVIGEEFAIACGSCGEMVYQKISPQKYRKEENYGTLLGFGQPWVYRGTFGTSVGTSAL